MLGLVLEDDSLAIIHSLLDIDLELLWLSDNTMSMADSAMVLDGVALASTVWTVSLLSHDHTRSHTDLLDDHTFALAVMALANRHLSLLCLSIVGTGSLALWTNLVTVQSDRLGRAEVQLLKRYSKFDLHVVSLGHTSMASEHVENTTSLLVSTSAFLELFQPLEASSVVDELLLLVSEHFVGLGQSSLLSGSR